MKTQKQINLEFVANNSELVATQIENAITAKHMVSNGVTFEKVLSQISWKCGEFRYDIAKDVKKYGMDSLIESCAMKVMMHQVSKNVPMSDYEYLRMSVRRQAINL